MTDHARTTVLTHARDTLRAVEVCLQRLPLPYSDAEGNAKVALRDAINALDTAILGEEEDAERFAQLFDQSTDPDDELPF